MEVKQVAGERRMKKWDLWLQVDEDDPTILAKRPKVDPALWNEYWQHVSPSVQKHFVKVATVNATSLQDAWAIFESPLLQAMHLTYYVGGAGLDINPKPGDVIAQDMEAFMRRSARAKNKFFCMYYDNANSPEECGDTWQPAIPR